MCERSTDPRRRHHTAADPDRERRGQPWASRPGRFRRLFVRFIDCFWKRGPRLVRDSLDPQAV